MTTPRTLELILRVTPELIARGVMGDCRSCPIALAVQAAFPMARAVGVGLDIRLWLGGSWYAVPTTADMRDKMWQFDRCRGMKPFEAKVTLTEMP